MNPAHIPRRTTSRTDWTASANQSYFDTPAVPTPGVDCAVSMSSNPQPLAPATEAPQLLAPATEAMDLQGNEVSTEAALHVPTVINPEVTRTLTLSTEKKLHR
ncbi:hypothetical protein DPMN_003836 [Dreissena polymorpha]|uniref:Uncharacterized protein n=1 Tax=Dreissena polymorpha TaxID=45954 RepID=A0A9D4MPM8_DREPO|nr:hypothetical protein DPMN_003836 [Dreissena polymorpha]